MTGVTGGASPIVPRRRPARRRAPSPRLATLLAAAAAALAVAGARPALAQPRGVGGLGGRGGQPPRDPGRRDAPQRPRAPGDTTPVDTVLVEFAEPDSLTAALLRRPGFTATRYQGDTVRFLARQQVLVLSGKPAAVQRDQTLLVGATVQYDDSAQVVTARADSARGDTVVLRDPSQGADVVVRGGIRYDLTERRGVVTGFQTAVTQGETWFVAGERGAIVADTVVDGRRVFYARDGSVTSCNESAPHYHFEAKEIKMISKSVLVIRPAVLYIGDVPVMWLPFVFSDPRSGRRSGLLSPRFGVAELLRNSPSYRRTIENVGYYWQLGDTWDALGWTDWRSGARAREGDPGYVRLNIESRYRILDRFLQGQVSLFQEWLRDGRRNTGVTLRHEQAFNQNRRVSANLNWVQNTTVRQQNTFNPAAVLGTINSALNFSDRYGPASLQLGGTASQYPGRPQQDIRFPDLSVTARTISVTPWLDWTPVFSLQNQQSLKVDQGIQFAQIYRPRPDGGLDSTTIKGSRRNTTARFDTPLKIFDFNWANNFAFNEEVQDFPATRVVYGDIRDSTTKQTRVFPQTFTSSLDWNTSFALPRFFQGSWNVSPTVALSNVDGRYGLLVRTEQSGGNWVAQRKRASFGLSAAPTFYAFPPGFGPFERFRHSVSPVISYSYSPQANVGDRFLQAIGARRQGYLGSLVQNRVSLQLSTNLEAKRRAPRPGASEAAAGPEGQLPPVDSLAVGRADTARAATGAGAAAGLLANAGGSANALGDKLKVLSVQFSSLSYDFARADSTGRGFVDPTFNYNVRSDLLPGFDFRAGYSLFLGDPQSDTATFKPYRTEMGLTFSLDRNSSVYGAVARLFGRRVAPANARTPTQSSVEDQPGGDPFFSQQTMAQQAAGSFGRNSQFEIPTQDWRLSFTYTESRQRPDLRGPLITQDPALRCEALRTISIAQYDICRLQSQAAPAPGQVLPTTTLGGPIFVQPPQRSINANSAFHITEKWAAQWTTTFDLRRGDFASNQVTLQRELHDWRATFGFTQAPNGNFAFTFFIALKAEPDLKFNYNRQNYPRLNTP